MGTLEGTQFEAANSNGTTGAEINESKEKSENIEAPENVENIGNTENSQTAMVHPAEPDETMIDAAVTFINDTLNRTVYTGSVDIGNHILENFFNNDIGLASSKNPRKNTSYRKLCERDDLLINPMQLSTMVRVACQERFLSEKDVNTGQITYTHKASLTKLENNEQKIRIIKECIENGWSTRDLDQKIAERIDQLKSEPKISLIRKTASYIKAIDKFSGLDDSILGVDQTGLSELNKKQRENLEKKLEQLKTGAEECSRKTEAIQNNCADLLDKLSQGRVNEQQNGEENTDGAEKSEE